VQPRTLEVLRGFGLADELVRRGNPAVRLRINVGSRVVRTQLFDIGLDDTAFPFLLFVSQAETEAVLGEHLAAAGVRVDRGVRLVSFAADTDGLMCLLQHHDGSQESLRIRYLAGCDGAHSTVRERAGIPFLGGGYPQTFLLADLDVDGLEDDAVNAYLTEHGPLLFFPLGRPAPWRVITMRPPRDPGVGPAGPAPEAPVAELLAELQTLSDAAAGAGRLRLRDPVWASEFHLHHRHAARYRSGRVFLAGDAAHIHSPAGAQGMNTGIQDAVNLGWKLALVTRGLAPDTLLDSYDAERRPVGAFVLRFTDRAFTAAISANPLIRLARTQVAPRLLPVALRFRAGRAAAFRTVSQLDIRYRRSPAVQRTGRRARRGPQPGDRLPDARVSFDGRSGWLQEPLRGPGFQLLLCGPVDAWNGTAVTALQERHGGLLRVHRLDRRAASGALHDDTGRALARLHVRRNTALLIRPDGHIGCRTDDTDLVAVQHYLASWLRIG
jgi:2-polyprenyl-6-methoxyphenol hydroxylase-like FAD-dependent oxidoreductase